MKNISTILFLFISVFSINSNAQNTESLIPSAPSKAPDYFCTWSVQGYVVNYEGAEPTREAMAENYLFGTGKYENWINFFPKIREDLYFVMDDSWDIPLSENSGNNPYLGAVELSETRFPSYTGTHTERLKRFSDKVKSYGWKGLGGWICAQQAPIYGDVNMEAYWTERLKAANEAGFDYWKVDWGKHEGDGKWRSLLTNLGKNIAPNLYIEHAMNNEFITFSDVFRTYDVENITAQPVTIQRICNLLGYKVEKGAKGIINCEDEPYIAVGLGCAIGVMRHPFNGGLPNGKQDIVFPPVGRDIKNRRDEIVRGIRWHRIAEPFGVGNTTYNIDTIRLEDNWNLQEHETWVNRPVGERVTASAPARVSRGMELAEVSNLHPESKPFILTSRYPNGAIAIVSIGRALDRKYISSKEIVTVKIKDIAAPIGIFGQFKEVILYLPENLKGKKVWAQDLAGDAPVDITDRIKTDGKKLIITDTLIQEIGLMAASDGDKSDPGLVIQIKNN